MPNISIGIDQSKFHEIVLNLTQLGYSILVIEGDIYLSHQFQGAEVSHSNYHLGVVSFINDLFSKELANFNFQGQSALLSHNQALLPVMQKINALPKLQIQWHHAIEYTLYQANI